MIIIGLGSNIGDRLFNLRKAANLLIERLGPIYRFSDIWESEPWGYTSENLFFNALCAIQNDKVNAANIMKTLLQIEEEMGRKRYQNNQYADRIIDLDLISYNDLVLHTDEIEIPHPRMHLRRFVLLPLEQVCPSWYHPVLKKSVKTLLLECPDNSIVRKTNYALL